MNIKRMFGRAMLGLGMFLLGFFLFLGVILFAVSLRNSIDKKIVASKSERDFMVGNVHYKIVACGDKHALINVTLDSLAVEEHNIKLLMGQLATYPFITSKNMVEDSYRKQKITSKKRRK